MSRTSGPSVSPASFSQSRLPTVVQANCDSVGIADEVTCCDGKDGTTSQGWTVRADAMFLHRQTPASAVLAFNTGNQAESLNANSFRLGVHAGYDLSISRQFMNNLGIEMRYFGFDHWNSNVTAATTPGDLLQINSAIPIFTLAGDSISANYKSTLNNAELSLSRSVTENVTLLGGYRYLELDERGTASLINPGVPFDYRTDTRNRLSGFQLGSKLKLWDQGEFFSLGAVGKAGIYGNRSAQNSNINTGVITLANAGRGTSTAFIGELGFIGSCRLTERLSLRGGYNMLWLTDLALASEQLASSDFANGTGLSNSGNLFYHGATTGLEYSW